MFIVAIHNDKVRFKIDEQMQEIFGPEKSQAEGIFAGTQLIYLHITRSKNSALQCRLSFKTPSQLPVGCFSDSKLMIEYKETSVGSTSKKLPFFITSYNLSVDKVHDTPGVSASSYVVTMVAQNYVFHLLSTKTISALTSSRDVSSTSNINGVDAQFSKDIKDFVIPNAIAEKCFGTVEVSDDNFKNMYVDMRFRPNPMIIRNTYYSYMLNFLRFYKTSVNSNSIQYQSIKEFPQIYYNFYLNSEDKLCINICKSTPSSSSISESLDKANIRDVNTKVSSSAIIKTYGVTFENKAIDAIIDAFDNLVHKSELDESIKISYPLLVGKEAEDSFIYGASPLSEDDTFGTKKSKKAKSSLSRSVLNLKDKNKDDVDCPIVMYGLSVLPDNFGQGGKVKLALGVDRVFMENAEEIGFDFSMC